MALVSIRYGEEGRSVRTAACRRRAREAGGLGVLKGAVPICGLRRIKAAEVAQSQGYEEDVEQIPHDVAPSPRERNRVVESFRRIFASLQTHIDVLMCFN